MAGDYAVQERGGQFIAARGSDRREWALGTRRRPGIRRTTHLVGEIEFVIAQATAEATRAEGSAAPERMRGAVYVSCAGRGGPHFGAPSAEMQIVRRALGDVPLVGFFAGGEIAHHRIYGYTGVLTVFTMPAA